MIFVSCFYYCQGRGLLGTEGNFLDKVLLLGGLSQSACPPARLPHFYPTLHFRMVAGPVGGVERPVLYKPEMFYGEAGFRLNFSELFLYLNVDNKFRDVLPSFCFCGACCFACFSSFFFWQ